MLCDDSSSTCCMPLSACRLSWGHVAYYVAPRVDANKLPSMGVEFQNARKKPPSLSTKVAMARIWFGKAIGKARSGWDGVVCVPPFLFVSLCVQGSWPTSCWQG